MSRHLGQDFLLAFYKLGSLLGDPRNTWRIVNELMSRNSHNSVINEIKLPCGNSIYDSHELSNAFNDHFSSIGLKLANNIHANEADNSSHLDYLAETGHFTFELKPTSVPKVLLLLSRLCKSKSTGLDKISAKLLRECADFPDLIAESLINLLFLEFSLMNGNFRKSSPLVQTG